MDSIPKDQVPPQEVSIEEKTQEVEDDGDDIISNLPDSVLCHILSKLPTKHAVATAILSTRWKNLFASIPYPCLEFDDSLILHPKEAVNSNPEDRRTSFINFVDRVLNVILYDVPHITQFRLKCDISIDDTHIIEWICNALLRNVLWLDLDICLDDCGLLFDTLSGHPTLRYLKLSGVLVCVPSSFCLPNLKCLFLEAVEFLDDESIYRLITGCPVLEDLSMRYCDLHYINILNISSPSLKVLIIINGYIDEFGFSMVLDTPGLELFYYEGCVAEGYTVKNLNSLLKAILVVGPTEEQLEEDSLRFNQYVAQLVKACCNVESLLLSKVSIAAVEQSSCPMPKFRKLTKLQLVGFGADGWELLPQFLECAPNLEFLDIRVGSYGDKGFYEDKGCYTRFKRRMPESVPVCLSSHLEKIQIRAFTGVDDELDLVRYFLENAKVLKRIEISSYAYWVKILYYRKILSNLPRLSETCQLLVLNEE